MTIAEGEIAFDQGHCVLRIGSLTLDLSPDHLIDGSIGKRLVTFAVRPEDILIGRGHTSATVRIVEPTGHESIVLVKAGGVDFTVRLPGDARLSPGETIPSSSGASASTFSIAKRAVVSMPTAPLNPARASWPARPSQGRPDETRVSFSHG